KKPCPRVCDVGTLFRRAGNTGWLCESL
ncbi:hypothetical protein D030_0783B, partial [Vibrio parahaemolyticus AQ3810]